MSVSIPISIGELLDKYSILTIKREQIKDESKQILVEREINVLQPYLYPYLNHVLLSELKEVNQTLWTIEDNIRLKERDKTFDHEFIQLARSVYQVNDVRAEIKRKINLIFKSNISEVKEYINYNEPTSKLV